MGERWIAEAEDLQAVGTSGEMDGGKPRVTLHVTVSKPGTFDAMHGVLTRAKAEPHILYDPATDRMGQFFPLDRSARALRNDGDRRTNGHGTVNIQIEVCAMPDGFTRYWKPGPNWAALLRAIRSWGVPDAWPAGRLSATGSDAVDRTWSSYSKAGWFGHCNVPGNDHWDPGPISQVAVFGPKENDMQLTDKMTNTLTGKEVTVEGMIDSANKTAYQARQLAAASARDAAATLELVKAMAAKGVDLSADDIAAAVKAGVDAATKDAVIITGDVTVTPTPSTPEA